MKNRAYLVITNNTQVGRVLELDLDVIEERILINLSNETLDDLIITEIAEEELKMLSGKFLKAVEANKDKAVTMDIEEEKKWLKLKKL